MGGFNQRLLISLIIVYAFIGAFSSLFIPDFQFGFLGVLFNFTGTEFESSGFPLLDIFEILFRVLDFMITFIFLPFQAVIDNALNITGGFLLRIIFFFLGLLNNIVIIFYIKGFI